MLLNKGELEVADEAHIEAVTIAYLVCHINGLT